jgi:DNA-binding SARP family transcriptional activator
MSHLKITLFGGFQAELGDKPLVAFKTDKNRALLAYLVLESEHPHRRESLATLLWGNHPESVARNSLRQALYQLGHILPLEPEKEPHLLIFPNQVQFNPASHHWIDVIEFKQRITTSRQPHPEDISLSVDCLENLHSMVELYKGDILEGFTLKGCPQFTEWQIINQEVCHHQVLAALSRLADYYEANFAYDQLIDCTQRKIELEPWRESAYRRQMWALTMTGQRERALLRYKLLEEILQREMGIQPTNSIRRLYEQIRDGDLLGLDTHTPGWSDEHQRRRTVRKHAGQRQPSNNEKQSRNQGKASRRSLPALQSRARDMPLARSAIAGSVLKQGRTPSISRGFGKRRTKRLSSPPGRTRG